MLLTTLSFGSVDGFDIAFQNGIPVPSFEPQDRTIISLHGSWQKRRFQADHDASMMPRDSAWHKELERREGSYLRGGESDLWQTHQIPSPENELSGEECAKAAETYEDAVWYRRTITLGAIRTDAAYTLKSLGMSYIADIWLNGQWVGYHEGGFTPFAFDVTPYLQPGDNDIRVRIDNPPWGSRNDTIPALAGTDFFNYTGIIQDLYIEIASQVHVVRADIVPLDTEGRLRCTVVVDNRDPEPRHVWLEGTIYEADSANPNFLKSPLASSIKGAEAATNRPIRAEIVLEAVQAKVLRFEVAVERPKLWSAGNPNLYVAEFKLQGDCNASAEALDCFHTQFGIRTIKTQQTKILLNESPVFLAGIARHEEWPDTGRTASWERILDDLHQIKRLHANFVRTGHYPNHIYTYLLLDRMGLLAASEIPLWQFETGHYEAQEIKRLADQMWREMILSQYNRPSVIMWSTQNESKDVELRLAFNRRMVRDLRERYDDGRLVTQSAAADQPGEHDPSMEPLDVAGWTMYFGIFHGGTYYEGTRSFLEAAHAAYPDKPILNTEFGHWTGEGGAEESKQLAAYEDTLRALIEKAAVSMDGAVRSDGYVAGIDFWIMYDWYVNHNQWIDTFGIYRMNRRTPKRIAELISRDYEAITGQLKAAAVQGAKEG
ncbi:glycoside hydrolase family 2 protein [Paenibacillus tarimensis]